MKNLANIAIGFSSAIALLILAPFVTSQFNKAMELVNAGVEINSTAIVVFGVLGFLGLLMYLAGHIFHAFNKKVSEYFEAWFN
ncbi:hypothetical protein [Alishewanella longhuensis]